MALEDMELGALFLKFMESDLVKEKIKNMFQPTPAVGFANKEVSAASIPTATVTAPTDLNEMANPPTSGSPGARAEISKETRVLPEIPAVKHNAGGPQAGNMGDGLGKDGNQEAVMGAAGLGSSGMRVSQAREKTVSREETTELLAAACGFGSLPVNHGKGAVAGQAANVVKPTYSAALRATESNREEEAIVINHGASISIRTDTKAYKSRMEMCRCSLIARVVLNKGDAPYKVADLKGKLSKVWGLKDWKLIALGRGFFHVILANMEAKNLVWSRGTIMLNPGTVRLQEWSLGFNPNLQKIYSRTNLGKDLWFELGSLGASHFV